MPRSEHNGQRNLGGRITSAQAVVNKHIMAVRRPKQRHILRLLIICSVMASLNFIELWVFGSLSSQSHANEPLAQVKLPMLLPQCPLPNMTDTDSLSDWRYYADLSVENAKMASRVKNLTKNPILGDKQSRIPHRLIFTHYIDLFNCSNILPPELYNIANNAKATVNAYGKIWPDLEFVFLSDDDCIQSIQEIDPSLAGRFHRLEGKYKGDICRVAYLFLHGGYYFDVDVLVVRPYVAPTDASLVTVKGADYPEQGFFQAFVAAEKGNPIIRRSLNLMDRYLRNNRIEFIGPLTLMEAWIEIENITNATYYPQKNTGVHLLTEVWLDKEDKTKRYKQITEMLQTGKNYETMLQHPPTQHGDRCQFSTGACNVIVWDE